MMDYFRFKEIYDLFAAGHIDEGRHLLMEFQSRFIALHDEMNMLKLRLQSMEDALYLSENLFNENGFYWLRTNGVKQGPFCPRCYSLEGTLIRLERDKARRICPYCHEKFAIAAQDAPASAPQRRARILPFAK